MAGSNTRIVLVVCNDYGELAFALYFLARQSFAQNTTLMLPPRLHAQNPDVLPGRTRIYHSLDDVQKEVDGSAPGVLGLFCGYLLPVHSLCSTDELGALLESVQAQGWKCFTSDPFFGLFGESGQSGPAEAAPPKRSFVGTLLPALRSRPGSEARNVKSRPEPGVIRDLLREFLHVYPCGESPEETAPDFGARVHFHNPAIFLPSEHEAATTTAAAARGQQQWLFVLGDEDYAVQEEKYGKATFGMSQKFRKILLQKLHETLAAGRVPTLVAPAKVIKAVSKNSPAAASMELFTHCEYARFQALLRDAEYVFFWNAASFSAILRTLTEKPWFTFDDGRQLLRGSDAYAQRVSEWFYRGDAPPRLSIDVPLTREALQQETKRFLISSWRVRQGLLASPDPQSVLSALDPDRAVREAGALVEAFDMVQRLGEVVSRNELDGSVVVDTTLLAHSKDALLNALKLLSEQGAEYQAEFARLAAPTLAFFQPGVGETRQPIDSPGPDGKAWKAVVEAEMASIAGDLFASDDTEPLESALALERAIEEAKALEAAFDIVQRLGKIVAANELDGSFVVDSALLAYPKSGIKSAVRLLLERGVRHQADFARMAAPTLAFFQRGVGAGRRSIDAPGLDGRPWKAAVEAEMVSITETLQG